MSNAIDQRIVEMSFENHKFEKGIQQSQSSLKNFSNALDSMGTGKDFNGLEKSLESTASKFSMLEQIGIGALRRIGEAAINAGTNLFKGLAIEPINQGFGEMELKMNSTQTIMASTGETLATVNNYLRELNEYSDRTIYSFANMTQNIGKFTNAGVKLEMAVASIKGISNAAALAGANSDEASRAMYNFAQALSAGYVKLVDWKSIELANMATVEFKEQLLEAAVAAGTVAKRADGMYQVLSTDMSGGVMENAISATKNFNESLSYQWMTTEALTKTLSNYADETTEIGKRASKAATQVTTFTKLMATLKESVGSGWSQTFEIIFGDFNEARDLWSAMNDTLGGTINKLSDMRNELLSGGLGSGWKQFMQEGIEDTTTFADTLAAVAGEAGVDIDTIIKRTGSMEKAVKENWLTGEMLTETITRMSTSIEKLSVEELKNAGYTDKTKTELLKLRDALLSGSISAEDFAKKMTRMSGRENIIQGLKNSVVALLTAIRPISRAFDQIFPPKTAENLYQMTEMFKNFTKNLIIGEETVKKLQRTFAGFFAVVDIGWQTVKFLGKALYEIVGIFIPLNGNILEMTASVGDFLVALNQIIKRSGVFEYGLLGVKIAAITIRDMLKELTGGFIEFIHVLWTTDRPLEYLGETIKNVFASVINKLRDGVSWVSNKFTGALKAVQRIFSNEFNIGDGGTITKILEMMKDFLVFLLDDGSSGIVTLSEALNSIDFSRIATFVTGGILLLFVNQLSHLTKVTSDLVSTTNGFVSKFSKKLFGTTTKFRDLAIAIGVLSASLYVLSNIPWPDLKRGLLGLAGAMVIFVGAYVAMQAITVMNTKKLNGAKAMESALNLTAMAGGLAIMAIAIDKISKIDEDRVWESVGVVAAMMGVITAYQALTVAISLIPGTRAANIGMSMMASGLLGLIGIVVILNNVDPQVIAASLAKLAGSMMMLATIQALFALAARVSGGNKVAVNVFGIAGGILAMIGVIKLIGLLTAAEITAGVKNIFLLGGILAAIQIMFSVAARIGGGIKFKANVFSIQIGLLSMIALIKILGTMTRTELQNGIVSLGAMALIIGGLEIVTAAAARLSGGAKLQKILGSVSLTMIAFTGLIAVVGKFKDETLDRGFSVLKRMTNLIMQIEIFTAVIGQIKGTSRGAGMLIGLTMTILTITASLALLSMIDQEALSMATDSLSKAVFSIGIMAIGVGVLMRALNGLSSGFSALRSIVNNLIPGFVVLGAVVLAGLGFMKVMSMAGSMIESVSWDSLTKFAAGLGIISVLAIAFTALMKVPGLASGMSGLQSLIPGFAAMIAVVLATSGFFWVVSKTIKAMDSIEWNDFAKFTAGLAVLSVMLVGLSALSPLLAVVSAIGLPAIGGLLIAIGGVSLVVLAFAGLAMVMDALFATNGDKLTSGFDKLVEIGNGIGRFLASIVSGFSSETFIGFGEGIAGFVSALNGVDMSGLAGVESLAKAIMALTASSLLDGISRLLNFGKDPGKVFGEQMKSLIKAFGDISIDGAAHASSVMRALGPMIDNFSKLTEAARSVPNSGGVLGFLVGENEIDDFGKKIRKMVQQFKKFTQADAVNTASILSILAPTMTNFGALVDVAGNISNSGGVISRWVGDNEIDDFAKQIKKMINHFTKITIESAVKTADIFNALGPAMTNFGALVNVAGQVPNSGGALGWTVGENDIDDFGKQLKNLIKTFGNLDRSKIQTANGNMTLMTMSMLPGLEKFVTLYANLKNIEGMVTTNSFAAFSILAEEIKSFVGILKGVDVSVVAPALATLDQINESFKMVGQEVVMSAIESIRKYKPLFQIEVISMLNDAIWAINSRQKDFSGSFTNLIAKTIYDSKRYMGEFKIIGQDMVKGLQNGMTSGKGITADATKKMVNVAVTTAKNTLEINSPSRVFSDIGKWLPAGLAHGIERNSKVAILASANMAGGVEDAVRNILEVHSESPKFNSIGEWVSKSLGTGMENAKGALMNTAKDLGIDTSNMTVKGIAEGMVGAEGAVTSGLNTLLDLLTGKTTMTEAAAALGVETGEALSDGIVAGTDSAAVTGAYSGMAKDAFQAFKEGIDKRREYNLMSTWQEIEAWQEFAKQYAKGTETRMKADKEIARLRFEYSKTWIDKEKYYKRLSLEEELAAWERVQARYEYGHEYRMQAEREVFRLKEEIWQAEYNHALDYIDEEKYYGRMDLSEELNEWKKIANMTKDNSDERKKADREIFRLENEIRDTNLAYEEQLKKVDEERTDRRKKAADDYYLKEKEITEKLARDIESLTDVYENAVDSRTKTLYSSYGLFDKVEKPAYVSGFELINNLEDQNTAFDKWQQSIGTLAAKGVDDGLVKELRDMGPKSLAQINALNRLSDSELERYVDLWQKKSQEAKDQAIFELQDLKDENDKKIQELTLNTDIALDEYKKIWDDTLIDIDSDTKVQLDEIQKNWTDSVGGMTETGITLIKQFKLDWFGEIATIVTETKAQMTELKTVTESIKPAVAVLGTAVSTTLSNSVKTESVGKNIVTGIATGITKNTTTAIKAATDLGKAVYGDMNSFWMIQSPSKKTAETGRFIVMGLAEGMRKFAGLVSNESMSVGEKALAAMSTSMNSIPDLLGDDINAFTITPVLDLSNVQSGMGNVNSILNGMNGLDLTSTMNLLPKTNQTNQNGILTQLRDGLLSMTNPQIDLTGKMTVEIRDDKGEIVGMAVKEVTDMLRRESR